MLPTLPFNKVPYKEWKPKQEKKTRVDIDEFENFQTDFQTFNKLNPNLSYRKNREIVDFEEVGLDTFDQKRNYQTELLSHLANLLPGEINNGQKSAKEANLDHLQELRVKKVKVDRLYYLKKLHTFLRDWRKNERERRKHYLLKEYEFEIQKFVERRKQEERDLEEQQHKETILKEVERRKLFDYNLRRVKVKEELDDDFQDTLDFRYLEDKQLLFYTENFPKWQIEGHYKQIEEEKQQEIKKQKILRLKQIEQEEKEKLQQILYDQQLLDDDKALTKQIETMMLRYGIIKYEKPKELSDQERVDQIFKLNKQHQEKIAKQKQQKELNEKLESEEINRLEFSSRPSSSRPLSSRPSSSASNRPNKLKKQQTLRLELNTTGSIDFQALMNEYKKNVYRGKKVKNYVNPFTVPSLQDTGDILIIHGHHFEEIGAFALGTELVHGACPVVEELYLKDCFIRDTGFKCILQSLKMANIYTIQRLNFAGNYLSSKSMNWYHSICASGILMNVSYLNFNANELKDHGVEELMRIILADYFMNLQEIYLQHNSITDHGFHAIINVMLSSKEKKCPMLERISLEHNLISSEKKRQYAPLPKYISL